MTRGLPVGFGVVLCASLASAADWRVEIAKKPVVSLTFDAPLPAEVWQTADKYDVVDDELAGRKVLDVAAKKRFAVRSVAAPAGDYAVEALVRFSDPEVEAATGSAVLRVGANLRGAATFAAYSLAVSRRGARAHSILPTVADGSLAGQPPRPGVPPEKNLPTRWLLNVAERFPLASISPVWDEEYRIGIENDMLALPLERDRWRRLKIEVRGDRVRMYHDGLLAFDEPRDAVVAGSVVLELLGPARLAELTITPIEPLDSHFEPIVLDDMVNAGGFVATDSLPVPGTKAWLAGVPLVFPARTAQADHVDVGRSVFRHRRSSDADAGDPIASWPTMGQLDPARLRVRVPRGAYSKFYLLAASDDDPNNVPLVTARFYKPRKGWAIDAVAEVPSFTAQSKPGGAAHVSVRRPDGSAANLWLVTIDLDAAALASEMRKELVLHLELTKEVQGFRHYPDPFYYGYFQAGLPSAVRIFAATLERAPVEFIAGGHRPGNTYTSPEQPVWRVTLKNPHADRLPAVVTIDVTSATGKTEHMESAASIAGNRDAIIDFRPQMPDFGLYTVRTTVETPNSAQSREGTFTALPPDTRKATAKNTRWGLWYWNGAHDTHPVPAESMQLFKQYGSLVAGHAKLDVRTPWRLGPTAHLGFRATPAWALEDPHDPAEYAKYAEECGLHVAELLKKEPDIQYVSIFAEHSISLRVTHGTPPEAYGKPWYDYTPEEQKSIRAHLLAAQAAFEGVRKHAPNVKFLFGHCGPLFSLPFMKQGYPKEWFDGYGLDSPQFERMPERPPRAVECNYMYFLNEEMKRLGYDKELVHVESYYPPSHPLALGLRESADSIPRTAVLSLANGTDRFLACWTLDDPEGAWGSQHYGAVGIIGRGPELNPKPGAAAYGTLTTMLDTAKYDGWASTGSHSAYCVRFKETPTKHIYALWTIRGTRPITVTAARNPNPRIKFDGEMLLTDENGNEKRLELVDGKATFDLTPTIVWLTTSKTTVATAELGAPRYTEAPGEHRLTLDDFKRRDEWSFTGKPDERYATNSWDMPREPAPYSAVYGASHERNSQVVRITCDAPTSEPNLTGRYAVFAPNKPIAIPGKGRALGLWANGNSGWGRVVYEITDSKGEIFQSIGTKDDWNCDDTHSWSNFNFDGWRYMEFPLPNNSPGDDYREADSVWWNHSAEGIVDLPVSLTKLIFEMPTHQLYIDKIVPVENKTIEIDDLLVVYDSAGDMTDEPVKVQRAAAGMLRVKSNAELLPNPIAAMQASGVGEGPKITRFFAPEQFNDGTRIHAAIEPVAGATEYQIWISPYADGRGAKMMLKSADPAPLVNRLRPGIPLYFFATYTAADGKPSKPSQAASITLKDEFLQK